MYALFDAARNLALREIGITAAAMLGLGGLKFLVEDDHAVSYILFTMTAIGVGSIAVFYGLGRVLKNDAVIASLATLVGLAVPGIMVAEGWDDHNRSHRTPAPDLASDYLESCAPNAILFTNGDNDTFPLWYAQEVEGVRTDVRLSLIHISEPTRPY